jgi:hypothetical protein
MTETYVESKYIWFDSATASLAEIGKFQFAGTAAGFALSFKVNHDEILILLRNAKAKG